MPFRTGLGTGLREPCPPNREVVFLGAPLNSISADGWNCTPQVTGAFTELDLTYSSINREACVALLAQGYAFEGDYQVTFRWYKEPSNVPLFTFSYTLSAFPGGWFYVYSYIGWTPFEINENGSYRVDISVFGAATYSQSIPFIVKGIPLAPPEPPPEPPEVNSIVEAFEFIANTMQDIYMTTSGWIWPFSLISNPFHLLYTFFHNLAILFGKFLEWVNTLADKLIDILSWDSIKKLILSWLSGIEDVIAWFSDWWDEVWNVTESWWLTISDTVKQWIDTATEGLSNLKTEWDKFWTVTFPTLLSKIDLAEWWRGTLFDINNLIFSAIKTAFPFYDDLVKLWSEIVSFFSNPLDWIEKKFISWFLGE
jgi:hypothetical protein